MCSAGGKTCFEVIPNFEPSKILFLVWNITFFASLQQSFFLGTHRSREFFFCFFEKVTKKYHFRPIHVGSIKCSLLCFSFTLVYKIERTFWIDQPYFVKDEICVCVREREGEGLCCFPLPSFSLPLFETRRLFPLFVHWVAYVLAHVYGCLRLEISY